MAQAKAVTVRPALHWDDEGGRHQSFALKAGETLLGRSTNCDLGISHPSVSREHAKILATDGIYVLIDLGTRHGTRVNGQPIQACVLRSGDRLDFGGVHDLTYRFEDSADHPVDPLESLPADKVSGILHAELGKSRAQRMKLAQELVLAANIQRALLPTELPDVHGFEMRAFSRPTRFVGGDFYDVVVAPTRSFCGVLGDVSGKGVAAALLGAMVLGCLDARLRTDSSLEDSVGTVNGLLHEKGNGRFVTLFLFRFDADGRGRFVSAGHNPAFVYRREPGIVEEIASNNVIAGPFPSILFQSDPIDLGAGDVLLIYSDGLTEAEGVNREMLGEEPVRRLIRDHAPTGADAVKRALLDLLDAFTAGQQQNDDITFLILRRL